MLTVWEINEWRAGRQTRIPGPFSELELRQAPGCPSTLIKKTIPNPAVGAFFSGWRTFQRGGGKLNLLELLHTSYVRSGGLGLQCKDPRDKIYGLLGMASDASELGIDTDYTKTADEAFEQVARYLIARGHLDILKWCSSRRVQPPTWVPNFNAKIAYTWSDDMGVPLFMATGSRTQPTEPSNGSRPASIRLQGVRLDTITAAGTIFVHDDEEPYDQAAARQMFSELEVFLGHPSIYTETERMDAIWRIPICDREYHPTSGYFRRATADHSEKQFVALRTQPLAGDVIAETMSYQLTMQYYTDGVRPIRSGKGYVGLGPGETAPCDVIVLLYGATAPFILKPTGVPTSTILLGRRTFTV